MTFESNGQTWQAMDGFLIFWTSKFADEIAAFKGYAMKS